ncbi:MAG: uroporphyrinogen decarboxylase family protein [Candidatus Humimicrobiaceae bacterium]
MKTDQMTGKERIKAAIKFQDHDRVPVFPLIHWGTAGIIGETVANYAKNPDIQAKCLVETCKMFGYDGINAGVDVIIEAEAFGGYSEFPDYSPPLLKKHPIEDDKTKLKSLKVLDPYISGRMATQIKATEKVVKEMGKDKYVMSFIMGPLNCASQLRGVQNTVMDFILDPPYIEELLDFATDQVVEYGKALAKTGVDCVGIGEALASPNFNSPAHIYQFDFPRLVRLINSLHETGVDTILHICGDIHPIFEYGKKINKNILKETGADCLDIDYQVKMEDAIRETSISCRGNLDPSSVLLKGDRNLVIEKSKEIILNSGPLKGTILGAGCDMAYKTPKENIKAMMDAALEYGFFPINK